jgi:hypothetical protein
MPIDGRRDTLDQSRVDMVGLDHTLQFLEFRLGKGFGKGQTILFCVFIFTPDVCGPLCND